MFVYISTAISAILDQKCRAFVSIQILYYQTNTIQYVCCSCDKKTIRQQDYTSVANLIKFGAIFTIPEHIFTYFDTILPSFARFSNGSETQFSWYIWKLEVSFEGSEAKSLYWCQVEKNYFVNLSSWEQILKQYRNSCSKEITLAYKNM